MGLQRSFELSYSAVCILQSGHVCPLNERSATFLMGDRGRRYACDERAVYRVFSRKMLFHTSLSHYSLPWPCQISWVWHWNPPPTPVPLPSTHPCSPSTDSRQPGTRCPKACLPVNAHCPLSRCRGRELAGLSTVSKPKELLELQNGEDTEIEAGEGASRPEGSGGSHGKKAQPERPHYLLVLLGRLTWLGKEPLHITRHSAASFGAHQSTSKLTPMAARPGKYLTVSCQHELLFPERLTGCGVRRNSVFHFMSGRKTPH